MKYEEFHEFLGVPRIPVNHQESKGIPGILGSSTNYYEFYENPGIPSNRES